MNAYSEYLSAADIGTERPASTFGEYIEGSGPDGVSWPEPMPLVRPLPASEPFPVEALGTVLENAARGITEVVQCPLAIAGNSVLAAASLAAQAHVDVVHPATGRPIPTSLFLLTIAESGERKSAADAEALAAVRKHEGAAAETYKAALFRYRNEQEAYEACRAAAKKAGKGIDRYSMAERLQELGDEPKPPRKPQVVVTEPTFEGLQKLYAEGQPSLGLFSAEGGGFIGGHAMRDEGRLRALTGLSELWDGSPLRRTRSGDGSIHLAGRRLSLHLMVQPNVAPMLLADDMASGQGFLSRLLVCAPASTQGTRFQREPAPWARPAINEYNRTIADLLARPPRLIGDDGLDPQALPLTEPALARWRDFADQMERELAEDGIGSSIRGLRNKTPEMALRIAGVLTAIEEGTEITVEVLDRGIRLATFYLSEAKRLYEASGITPEVSRALKLLRWLMDRKVEMISLRDIQIKGPAALQEASAVKAAVTLLQEHNLCRVTSVATGGRPSPKLVLSPLAESVI